MKTMNIGIVAHVDAGKTTLTEQLLYVSGKTRQAGSVDTGTCVSDRLPMERRRGISVCASCVSLVWRDTKINIIDTPGHIDFAGEVERSLAALDGAVLVVSAVEGIQSHTKILWKALRAMHIPTLFVINKLDRIGSDARAVLGSLRAEFGVPVVALNACEGEGGNCRFYDSLAADDGEALEDMLLATGDDALADRYLAGAAGRDDIAAAFYEKARSRACFAAVLTAAKEGKGIQTVLDAILTCLPDAQGMDKGTLSGVVFKIEHDKAMGLCAYIRLFGGVLRNRDSVLSEGRELGKIAQIRLCDGSRFVDSGVLPAGEIAMVFGLADSRCGDSVGELPLPRPYSVSAALLLVSVAPQEEAERPALLRALLELEQEDPLLQFTHSPATGEMHVRITGTVRLEILEELLAERYGIAVTFSEPQVIFQETPKKEGIGYESYTMPKPCWAKVELLVEPLPRGSGIRFQSVIKDKVLPYRYQHHVELSVLRDCLKQGIFGWEVTDASITLIGGEYHSIHTHPLDFFVATPVAFLRALHACETVLLEPFVQVTMSADEACLGTILGHVLEMRGEFDSPVLSDGSFTLVARLPVQESIGYPSRFRSVTSGKGSYFSEFFDYRECPAELYKKLPRVGVDPLDRAKWILYCRSAL